MLVALQRCRVIISEAGRDIGSPVMQDTTTRIWDIRQPGKSLAVLSGRMGAVRSLRFSSDGRFLAMAEPADFVHVFDVKAGFHRYTVRQADLPCS